MLTDHEIAAYRLKAQAFSLLTSAVCAAGVAVALRGDIRVFLIALMSYSVIGWLAVLGRAESAYPDERTPLFTGAFMVAMIAFSGLVLMVRWPLRFMTF